MLKTRFGRTLCGALLITMLATAAGTTGVWSGLPKARAQTQDAPIRLKSVTFDPLVRGPDLSRFPAALVSGPDTTPGRKGLYLLQFDGPVTDAWKDAVQQLGVQLYGYMPEYAFVTRIDPATLAGVRALPFVRWVGPYIPAYRISPDLVAQPWPLKASRPVSGPLKVALRGARGQLEAGPLAQKSPAAAGANGVITLTVQAVPDVDQAALSTAIGQLGGEIKGASTTSLAHYLQVVLPANQTSALAATDGVVWIEPQVPMKLLNDSAGKILRVADARQAFGLYGAGQVVAVADTGLDSGDLNTVNPDIRGRVIGTHCLGRPSPCDWSDPNSHGTHVVGSVLGNGTNSGSTPTSHQYNGSYAGMAPEAKLVIQSIGAADGTLGGIPSADVGQLMRDAYNDGARIHSNSWGGPTGVNNGQPSYGGYVPESQQVDQAAWDHKDMLIVYAAGNSGADANQDGVIDPDSIGAPGTAKNILTVGASENEHPEDNAVWSSGYGFVAPILNSKRADNKNGMAPFSSRGPTADGRIKPDVVAPGTQVISVRTQKNVFESAVDNDSSRFSQTPLSGGTSNWQLVSDAHSGSQAWYQKASGPTTAKAMTVLFTPKLNLAPIGDAAMIRLWHKYRLTGDNALAAVFDDGKTTVWLASKITGSATAYGYEEFPISLAALVQQANMNLASVSVGFALYSPSGNYDSEWFIDDIQVGPYMNSLSKAGIGSDSDPKNTVYGLDDGTSMATPLTAGSMAVLREWFGKNGTPNPSSALLKAAVMNAAADMSPGQYGTGAQQEIPTIRPNNVTGWGRVDVLNVISPTLPSQSFFKDVTSGLRTGDTAQITFTIGAAQAASSRPLPVQIQSAQDITAPMQPGQMGGVGGQHGVPAPSGFLKTPSVTPSQMSPNAIQAPASVDQLVRNGGFEQNSDWSAVGVTFVYYKGVAHTGNYSARSLAGFDDTMSQYITIPADAVTATLKFYWLNTNPDVGSDVLQAEIWDQTLTTLLGTDTMLSTTATTWQFESSDFTQNFLDSLRGQTVALVFKVNQNNQSPNATFYVDDVSLEVGRGTATPSPTNTPSPSVTPQPSATPATTPSATPSATSATTPATTPSATPTPTSTVSPGTPVGPVAITLAWTDFPGQPAAAKALVNDLDLEVVSPDGIHYYGNQGIYPAGNPCLRADKFDTCNNVETVYIANAKAGNYQILVHGTQVAQGGSQPYAIAAMGPAIKPGTTSGSGGPGASGGGGMKVYLPLMKR